MKGGNSKGKTVDHLKCWQTRETDLIIIGRMIGNLEMWKEWIRTMIKGTTTIEETRDNDENRKINYDF